MANFGLHSPKQDQAYYSKKDIILCATGIQWGKSTVGALKLLQGVSTYNTRADNFLVLAPTYKIMEQSTKRVFDKVFGSYGKYNKVDACYKIKNGPSIYFRTTSDPDAIVGLTDVRMIWGDEAGLYSLYAWENIQGRAAFRRAQIVLTTSPYSMNWILKEIINPTKKGLRSDCEVIQARSDENPYFPKDIFEKRKLTMDARRFKMMYGGEFDRPEGMVYDCWDDDENIIDISMIDLSPSNNRLYGAIDWGWRDPFVLKTRAISDYGQHTDIGEFYKTNLTPSQIVDAVKRKHIIYKYKAIFCDPSRPEMIAELASAGIPAVPANNDIRSGIDAHYELIKTRRYKVLRGECPHTLDEVESYHYPEEKDLRPDQDKQKDFDIPVDQGNHCLDCDRYLSLALKTLDNIHQVTQSDTNYRAKHGNIKRGINIFN